MIQLNLIEAASETAAIEMKVQVNLDTKNKKSNTPRNILIALGSLAAILILFIGSLVIFGLPKPLYGIIPEAVLSSFGIQDPSRMALLPGLAKAQTTTAGGLLEKQREAERLSVLAMRSVSVENIVQEVTPKLFARVASRTNYSNYLPLEQISYQNSALSQLLVFINTAAPDNISFSDLVFEAPNYFYVRGVAENPTVQRNFLERLKAVSSGFKTPTLPENAPATDITAFGEFNVSNINLDKLKNLVAENEVAQEIKSLTNLDVLHKIKFTGLDKPRIEDFGVYKKYMYRVSANVDFSTLMNFLVEIPNSTVRIGVQKLEMMPGKKNLETVMNLVMYVAP